MPISMSINDLARVLDGQVVYSKASGFQGVSTDTRKDNSGTLFIALRGENHDAHDFLPQAVESGAAALLVDSAKAVESVKDKVSVVLVKDSLKALQRLANFWRRVNKFKVIGITGSNGKTTSKEFTQTILKAKFKVQASPASFNNHWGVPLSLLAIDSDTEIAVIEMGMNHLGELTQLAKIAVPDYVVVTTVGTSHIGEVGSQQKIAQAKQELYDASPGAFQVYNLDNEFTMGMYALVKDRKRIDQSKLLTFSAFNKEADVSLRAEKLSLSSIEVIGHIGSIEGRAEVSIFGRHNVNNLMVASALALAVGMTGEEVWQQLPKCKSIWGRNQLFTHSSGAHVLFDAYNSNLESASGLIKTLFEIDFTGKRMAILGQMLELGAESANLHKKLGELVAMTGFEWVWFIGADKEAFCEGIKAGGFDKNLYISDTYEEELAIQLGNMLNQQDVVILKASRGMKLENVLKAWHLQ